MSTGESHRLWRLKRQLKGICLRCGERRGRNGTTLYCRPCADHNRGRIRASRRKAVKDATPIRHEMAMALLAGRDPWR